MKLADRHCVLLALVVGTGVTLGGARLVDCVTPTSRMTRADGASPSITYMPDTTTRPSTETTHDPLDEPTYTVPASPVSTLPATYRTSDFSTDSDDVLLARMIFGEARGCALEEKIAVGYTAVTRAHDGKRWNGETVRDAILTPRQYSCFDADNVNLAQLKDPYVFDKRSFDECLKAACGILSGNYADPTRGATHYFNPKKAHPRWKDRMQKIGKIRTERGLSAHEFYLEK